MADSTNEGYGNIVSVHPHIHSKNSIRRLMAGFIIALLPSLGFGVFQYGLQAVLLIAVAVVGAIGTELGIHMLSKHRLMHTMNLHSLVVGLLVAAMLPAGCPLWIVFLGASLAILLGKVPFGSLGGSFIAPAILGMLVLFVSWPSAATQWQFPNESAQYNETFVAESPLEAVTADSSDEYDYSPMKMFVGIDKIGAIGTTSGLALLIGGCFLFALGVIRLYASLGFVIGLVITAFLVGIVHPHQPTLWFHLTTGYALFAAIFLINDIPASPVTEMGMILFGLLAGVLTIVFRYAGMEFASALFAVALSSLAIPFFDKIIGKPTFQSEVKRAG